MFVCIHDGFDRMVVVSVDRLIEWLRCSQKEKRLRDYIAGRRIILDATDIHSSHTSVAFTCSL